MLSTDTNAPLRGARVIIADHHAHTRTALREMVSTLGATTIINAGDAADVLRQVKARQIDVILCDYVLDGARDGQQLLEELRADRLIPLAAIFMMITGERSYKKVVAAAEFAPDDYLIKPFTANQLLERLTRVSEKKQAFGGVYTMIESGRAADALAECGRVKAARPQYAADALRLMVDLLITLKRDDEAQHLLQEILARKLVPWASMGLANVHYAAERLNEAEALLTGLSSQYPEYLGAHDLLAKVKQDLGKPQEALEVLEAAGGISSSNVSRLRRSGELASAVGDHEKAGRLYARVVDRVRNSSLARADDFVSLANAYMAQGREDEAERVRIDQKRSMRGSPDAELTACLMEYQRCMRPGAAGGAEPATLALDALLEAHAALAAPAAAAIEFDVFNACCLDRRHTQALAIGEALVARADTPARIRERVAAQVAAISAEQKRASAIVPLDQVVAMCARLAAKGWDEPMGLACKASIAHWTQAAPAAPLLAEAQERLAEVLRKYGMDDSEAAAVRA
ncbi:MAG TPA: response regulator [Burkholderiales bacterium]|jgi:CheY-like chemotaxis protein